MLGRSAQAGATAVALGGLVSANAAEPGRKEGKPLVWDMHGHLTGVSGTAEERISELLMYADRMGIDRLIVFMGLSFVADPTPERLRQDNDEVLKAIDH